MDLYGISYYDVENAQAKINNQREYLNNQYFITRSGTTKSLMEVSMSANLSERYYAQLVNKVNTLQQTMTNSNLMPVFLTITLDGWYHDLYYGDYSRFTDDCYDKLPENDKYGYLKTKAAYRQTFDVHDLYMVLRWQWDRFTSSRTFRKMRKGTNIGYILAVEPMESGVPHFHGLLYILPEYLLALKEEFKNKFNARMNVTQDKSRLSLKQISNGELNGFQWTLSNPVGYILKYVTKSFMNIRNQEQLDELQTWFIRHRIVRFTTSHTLVPQWVYSKVYPIENDWLYLSDLNINSFCEWSSEDDYFKFEDTNLNKTLMYEKGLYQIFQDGVLVHQIGERRDIEEVKSSKYKDKFVIRKKKETSYRFFKSPLKYGDWELLSYYNSLGTVPHEHAHFILVQNELIRRKLIKGIILSPNISEAFSKGIDEAQIFIDNSAMFNAACAYHYHEF